jgi:hypothetical protein
MATKRKAKHKPFARSMLHAAARRTQTKPVIYEALDLFAETKAERTSGENSFGNTGT